MNNLTLRIISAMALSVIGVGSMYWSFFYPMGFYYSLTLFGSVGNLCHTSKKNGLNLARIYQVG